MLKGERTIFNPLQTSFESKMCLCKHKAGLRDGQLVSRDQGNPFQTTCMPNYIEPVDWVMALASIKNVNLCPEVSWRTA